MDEQSERAVNQRDINEQLILSGLREQELSGALQEGEERYRSLFASAPMAVFVCDRDAVIQYYNQRAADLWGREPARGVERYCGSVTLWLPDGTLLPHAQSPMAEVLRTGTPAHNVEVFIERPDGSRLPVLVNFAALRNARGEITGAITSFIDITERKQAEEAVRQSEKQYRTLFESIDEGFCIIEKVEGEAGTPLDFRYVEANPAFAAQAGVSGVVGQTIRQAFPGEPEEWFDTYDTVLRTGEPIRFERDLATHGRVLELYAFRVDDETHRRVAVIFKDITERKRVEERIHDSEEKFHTLADNISQFAWMTDETGWIFWYNQRWYEYTGTTLEEMQGWGWQTVHHPDHVESVVEKISRAFETGAVWEDTFPLRGKDGSYRWFLSRAIPIRDGDGRIVRWFGTNTDIDEQKRAEVALRVAEEQKEQFIASLAHDLRTPLTTIKGAAQLLGRQASRSGTDDMTRTIPRLQAIDDAGTRMVSMIDALLDAARARGGRALDLERTSTDLVALTRRAIAAYDERETHRFHLHNTEPELTGEWDVARLERVLENFLSNACKYSPEGSAVTVTVAREGERDDGWAVLTVADAGIGIPAADFPHIFEQYYRASNARGVQGAGIGLIGAKQIIEQHGGAIAITSAEGEGTTVRIRLPFGGGT